MTNTIADTILSQLGGSRFIAMTGTKNLLDHGDALSGKLGRGASNGITHFKVKLDPSDTYTVTFHRVRGVKVTEKGEHSGVYAEDLRRLIESETGFALSL